MKGTLLITICFLILDVGVSISQQVNNDKDLLFQSGVIPDAAVYITQIPDDTGIYIIQAGSKNVVDVDVKAKKHHFTYNQVGQENIVSSRIIAGNALEDIRQFGNNNGSFHFVNSPDGNTSLQLNQVGANLHFEMHGSNSIGDNLEFKMTGSSRAIIVRNFK